MAPFESVRSPKEDKDLRPFPLSAVARALVGDGGEARSPAIQLQPRRIQGHQAVEQNENKQLIQAKEKVMEFCRRFSVISHRRAPHALAGAPVQLDLSSAACLVRPSPVLFQNKLQIQIQRTKCFKLIYLLSTSSGFKTQEGARRTVERAAVPIQLRQQIANYFPQMPFLWL